MDKEEVKAAKLASYSDGSLENDLPMQQLSELFNVNHFIVSQVHYTTHYSSLHRLPLAVLFLAWIHRTAHRLCVTSVRAESNVHDPLLLTTIILLLILKHRRDVCIHVLILPSLSCSL